MRHITSHQTNDVNGQISVTAMDDKGPGGAHHHYEMKLPDGSLTPILFQKGGIVEVGVNGVTQEALLAIVIDRLQSFNDGPFPSRENSLALTKCQEALHWLHARTRDRQSRGVEGVQAA